jgi:threonine/homoserine/homoserine lactone efflux protein
VITAILIHISYCVAGLAVLIGTIPLLYNTLRYTGATYLIWLGFKALFAHNATTCLVGKQPTN